jgi:hypothetical protein
MAGLGRTSTMTSVREKRKKPGMKDFDGENGFW